MLKPLLISFLLLSPQLSAVEIKASSGEFAPYSAKSLAEQGIATKIVTQAFALTKDKHQLSTEFLPWKRAIDHAEKGRVEVSYPYFKSAQRTEQFYFSDPLFNSVALVYGNERTQGHRQPVPQSLVCLPLGFAMGSMADIVEEFDLILVRPNYLIQCFQLLYKHRVDYVFADKAVAHYLVKQEIMPTPKALYPLPFFNTESSLHLITRKSPSNKALLEQFNQGLAKFKQTQAYQQLINPDVN